MRTLSTGWRQNTAYYSRLLEQAHSLAAARSRSGRKRETFEEQNRFLSVQWKGQSARPARDVASSPTAVEGRCPRALSQRPTRKAGTGACNRSEEPRGARTLPPRLQPASPPSTRAQPLPRPGGQGRRRGRERAVSLGRPLLGGFPARCGGCSGACKTHDVCLSPCALGKAPAGRAAARLPNSASSALDSCAGSLAAFSEGPSGSRERQERSRFLGLRLLGLPGTPCPLHGCKQQTPLSSPSFPACSHQAQVGICLPVKTGPERMNRGPHFSSFVYCCTALNAPDLEKLSGVRPG